jgi:tetratricopeptide (TPR) repeat protein
LYQKALGIYRRIGSESGTAVVLNNLGLVYDAQGDPATAEKMHRQALAGFRLLDNKNAQSKALGNIADERIEQGDLRHALLIYEESQELDREDTGRIAFASYNIAIVHQLQGDLAGAKQGFEQALAIWQKNGDQSSPAYSMWSLGGLLLQEADFAGARKMLDLALAIRSSAGEKITIAETQLALAELSLEEGRSPEDQEVAVRKVIDLFQKQQARDDEIDAWCLLSRTLLAEGKTAAAKEAMQHGRSLAAKSQNPKTRFVAAIEDARIEAAQKDAAHSAAGIAARKELAEIIAKSHELGYRLIELDARLARAELEMRAGQTAEGRAHLTEIEAEAKAIGYNQVARKAVIARG